MGQLSLDLPLRAALGRDDFLVSPSNAAAVAWIDRWPAWPGPALALYGPKGAGKTHLAEVWRARSGGIAIDPRALRSASVPALLGEAKAAVVDGADASDPEALLHLFNVVAETGGHLLLIAREPPARWGLALADLRSRLVASPAVAVAAPDDALLGGLIVKLFADRQLAVGAELVAYLLVQIERSFDAAQDAVAALDAAALAEQRAVTVPLARTVLARLTLRDRG